MDSEKRLAEYIVRTVYMNSVQMDERKVFAYSAEDAKFQVELAMGLPRFETVVYVGPVNPDCKCKNACVCGSCGQ